MKKRHARNFAAVSQVFSQAVSPYIAKAVSFGPGSATNLGTYPLLLTVNESPFVAYSVWMKMANVDLWPNSFYTSGNVNYDYFDAITAQYFVHFAQYPDSKTIDFNTLVAPSFGVWHHYLAALRADITTPIAALYIDDVQITLTEGVNKTTTGSGPWSPTFNGRSQGIATDFQSDFLVGDMADFWLSAGTNLVELDGTISETNRRKFISSTHKPVNPSGFPSGFVLLSGDATSFATNQGTGGNIYSAQGGTLVNATTSPSD